MRTTNTLHKGLFLATVLLLMAPGASAWAGDLLLGVDMGVSASSQDNPSRLGQGSSWGLRTGYELGIPVLRVIPEARLQFTELDAPDAAAPLQMTTARAGLKLGLEGLLGPALYGHLGYSHLSGDLEAVGGVPSLAPSYDMGIALDVTLLPVVNLGAYAGVQGLTGDQPDQVWRQFEAGIHMEVVF